MIAKALRKGIRTGIAVTGLAISTLHLPVLAQNTPPPANPPMTENAPMNYGRGGDWGLWGLVGLLGLFGLRGGRRALYRTEPGETPRTSRAA
jgi:hypothetical protein